MQYCDLVFCVIRRIDMTRVLLMHYKNINLNIKRYSYLNTCNYSLLLVNRTQDKRKKPVRIFN